MAYALNPQEIRFLQQIAEHETVGSISHLIRAIVTGVELTKDDLLSIEDHLMDQAGEIENEGLEVPPFFDAIRNIVARLVNTGAGSQAAPQNAQNNPLNYPGAGPQAYQEPKKARKPREPKVDSDEPRTPKVSRKEKYKEDLTPDNIPVYLLDIYEIINQVVEAKCADEIARRIAAEDKLAQLQNILKGM